VSPKLRTRTSKEQGSPLAANDGSTAIELGNTHSRITFPQRERQKRPSQRSERRVDSARARRSGDASRARWFQLPRVHAARPVILVKRRAKRSVAPSAARGTIGPRAIVSPRGGAGQCAGSDPWASATLVTGSSRATRDGARDGWGREGSPVAASRRELLRRGRFNSGEVCVALHVESA
jgi:hypothetical protein